MRPYPSCKSYLRKNLISILSLSLLFGAAVAPAANGAAASPLSTSQPLVLLPGQSTLSLFVDCPSSIGFALPNSSGTCSPGYFNVFYSATYTGIEESVGSSLSYEFYFASATGQAMVTFSVSDQTTKNTVLNQSVTASLSGGGCGNPSSISGTASNSLAATIATGDILQLTVNIAFSVTGLPSIISG